MTLAPTSNPVFVQYLHSALINMYNLDVVENFFGEIGVGQNIEHCGEHWDSHIFFD